MFTHSSRKTAKFPFYISTPSGKPLKIKNTGQLKEQLDKTIKKYEELAKKTNKTEEDKKNLIVLNDDKTFLNRKYLEIEGLEEERAPNASDQRIEFPLKVQTPSGNVFEIDSFEELSKLENKERLEQEFNARLGSTFNRKTKEQIAKEIESDLLAIRKEKEKALNQGWVDMRRRKLYYPDGTEIPTVDEGVNEGSAFFFLKREYDKLEKELNQAEYMTKFYQNRVNESIKENNEPDAILYSKFATEELKKVEALRAKQIYLENIGGSHSDYTLTEHNIQKRQKELADKLEKLYPKPKEETAQVSVQPTTSSNTPPPQATALEVEPSEQAAPYRVDELGNVLDTERNIPVDQEKVRLAKIQEEASRIANLPFAENPYAKVAPLDTYEELGTRGLSRLASEDITGKSFPLKWDGKILRGKTFNSLAAVNNAIDKLKELKGKATSQKKKTLYQEEIENLEQVLMGGEPPKSIEGIFPVNFKGKVYKNKSYNNLSDMYTELESLEEVLAGSTKESDKKILREEIDSLSKVIDNVQNSFKSNEQEPKSIFPFTVNGGRAENGEEVNYQVENEKEYKDLLNFFQNQAEEALKNNDEETARTASQQADLLQGTYKSLEIQNKPPQASASQGQNIRSQKGGFEFPEPQHQGVVEKYMYPRENEASQNYREAMQRYLNPDFMRSEYKTLKDELVGELRQKAMRRFNESLKDLNWQHIASKMGRSGFFDQQRQKMFENVQNELNLQDKELGLQLYNQFEQSAANKAREARGGLSLSEQQGLSRAATAMKQDEIDKQRALEAYKVNKLEEENKRQRQKQAALDLIGLGRAKREHAQQGLDVQSAEFMRKQGYPQERLNTYLESVRKASLGQANQNLPEREQIFEPRMVSLPEPPKRDLETKPGVSTAPVQSEPEAPSTAFRDITGVLLSGANLGLEHAKYKDQKATNQALVDAAKASAEAAKTQIPTPQVPKKG